MKDIKPLLNQSAACHTPPCSLNGVYQPHIPLDSTFYGISEYWYSVYDVLNLKGYYNHEKVVESAKVIEIPEQMPMHDLCAVKPSLHGN